MAHITSRLVQRSLDEPALVATVRALDVVLLDALVRAVGLEDAGELLAMVTPEQFVGLVDEDLWRAQGSTEEFDHGRFVTWRTTTAMDGASAQSPSGTLEYSIWASKRAISSRVEMSDPTS